MKKEKKSRKNFSALMRFNYWFDNRMTKGSLSLIKFLLAVSLILALLMGGLIILCGFSGEKGAGAVFWDSIATLLNAWMPYFQEGSLGYIISMTITAIAGVLFTSVLIGIITSAIEGKIEDLKRGNTIVLETDHIVVLGFYPGEYTLLSQLIIAAAGKPACVVIVEDMEREEMEENLRQNLDIPKNFRFVCRTADITDLAALEKISLETCRTVIIAPTDDMRTVKAVLAVTMLLREKGATDVGVNAIISRTEFRSPLSIAKANNITTMQTSVIIAKIIAHSCTQTGLSEAFREIMKFEGSEFYMTEMQGIAGLSFEEIMARMDNAVPVGVYHDGKTMLNPPAGFVLAEGDRVLVFAEERSSATLEAALPALPPAPEAYADGDEDSTDTVIIGHNETLPILLEELPQNMKEVVLAGQNITEEERNELEQVAAARNLSLVFYKDSPRSEADLVRLAGMAGHIVILNDHDRDPEKADMDVIFLLLNLRDIRRRYDMKFNITVEMQKEHNQRLAGHGEQTDFLVESSMSSLILAQLAENPELIDVYREILSNWGNELYLKNVGLMRLEGSHTVRELRRCMLKQGFILLGDMDGEKNSTFNRRLDEVVTLGKEDFLIVIGEK